MDSETDANRCGVKRKNDVLSYKGHAVLEISVWSCLERTRHIKIEEHMEELSFYCSFKSWILVNMYEI